MKSLQLENGQRSQWKKPRHPKGVVRDGMNRRQTPTERLLQMQLYPLLVHPDGIRLALLPLPPPWHKLLGSGQLSNPPTSTSTIASSPTPSSIFSSHPLATLSFLPLQAMH